MTTTNVANKKAATPSWADTVASQTAQLFTALSSTPLHSTPRIDGSGNEREHTARSLRRQNEKSANPVTQHSEPLLTTLMRWTPDLKLSLPGSWFAEATPVLIPKTPVIDTASFIRAVAGDFKIKDFGQGKPLEGRPVVFLNIGHWDAAHIAKYKTALGSMDLGAHDLLLVEAVDAKTDGDAAPLCFGVQSCRPFKEPAQTRVVDALQQQHEVKIMEHLQWLSAKDPEKKLAPSQMSHSYAGVMETLAEWSHQLSLNTNLFSEVKSRLDEILSLGRQVDSATGKLKPLRAPEFVRQMREALQSTERVAALFSAGLEDAMLSELKAMGAMVLTPKTGNAPKGGRVDL